MKKLFLISLIVLLVTACTPAEKGGSRLTVVDKGLSEEMKLCYFDTAAPEKGEQCRIEKLEKPLYFLIIEQCVPDEGCFQMEVLSAQDAWESCQVGDIFLGRCEQKGGF